MEAWREQLGSIVSGLLTLEVNTIQKCGMSAQKMPELPVALHAIVDEYSDYLAVLNYALTAELLEWAGNRIWEKPPQIEWQQKLTGWAAKGAPVDRTHLTNGAATFEALRWAAAAALRDDDVARLGPKPEEALPPETRAVVARIFSNSRQLAILVSPLETKYRPVGQVGDETPVLFGGTLEQTARALFQSSIQFSVPVNVSVMVRKAWDIGTETVLAQTTMQIDGDVVTRISPLIEDEHRDFLLGVHRFSVSTGVGQWGAIFDLVKSLFGDLGKTLLSVLK